MGDDAEFFVDLTEGRDLVINRIVGTGFYGSTFVMTLASNHLGVVEGKPQAVTALVARLRFDIEMAQHLRDALNDALTAVSTPTDVKAN